MSLEDEYTVKEKNGIITLKSRVDKSLKIDTSRKLYVKEQGDMMFRQRTTVPKGLNSYEKKELLQQLYHKIQMKEENVERQEENDEKDEEQQRGEEI